MSTGPYWRSWFELARLSNLPTIVTNVAAAAVISGAPVTPGPIGALMLAMALIYTAGMILNDVCDVESDRRLRHDRPLVSGPVTRAQALRAAVLLTSAGLAVVWLASVNVHGLLWTIGLVMAIVHYDVLHKRDPLAPLVMGLCRGLVYMAVAATVDGGIVIPVVVAAAVMTLYVAGITLAARRIPAVRPFMGRLVAAISLVDAAVLLWAGAPWPAAGAVIATGLTIRLQRWVSGD